MTINKFQGKTEDEALDKAKKEMGQGLVIMNVKLVKPKGFFGFLKTPYYELTAAMEDQEPGTAPAKEHRSIDLSADESIDLPKPEAAREPAASLIASSPISEAAREVGNILNAHATAEKQKEKNLQKQGRGQVEQDEKKNTRDTEMIEERLENLQQFLEKKLTEEPAGKEPGSAEEDMENPESVQMFRMLYQTLLDNEVDEVYINQLLDDVMKVGRKGSSMDMILSHVYQKLILKFGNPNALATKGKGPGIAFFIGPTGVGKTTTIAKIASKLKVEQGKKVAFLTADTYRISATEQLRTYANILDAPLSVIYAPEELGDAVEKLADHDMIFVDTAGFSHKNEVQREDIRRLLSMLDGKYQTTVYLVLSATTKYRDLKEICDNYRSIADYSLIFTKLDETSAYGNLLNIKLYTDADVSYTTNGQNVPDDISLFQSQEIVKKLLGGD
jgi:flagellar biosynthesis protein FlhF